MSWKMYSSTNGNPFFASTLLNILLAGIGRYNITENIFPLGNVTYHQVFNIAPGKDTGVDKFPSRQSGCSWWRKVNLPVRNIKMLLGGDAIANRMASTFTNEVKPFKQIACFCLETFSFQFRLYVLELRNNHEVSIQGKNGSKESSLRITSITWLDSFQPVRVLSDSELGK